MYRLKNDLEGHGDMRSVFLFGRDLHVTMKRDDAIGGLRDWLEERDHRQLYIQAIAPGVEDCFMELMSKEKLEET